MWCVTLRAVRGGGGVPDADADVREASRLRLVQRGDAPRAQVVVGDVALAQHVDEPHLLARSAAVARRRGRARGRQVLVRGAEAHERTRRLRALQAVAGTRLGRRGRHGGGRQCGTRCRPTVCRCQGVLGCGGGECGGGECLSRTVMLLRSLATVRVCAVQERKKPACSEAHSIHAATSTHPEHREGARARDTHRAAVRSEELRDVRRGGLFAVRQPGVDARDGDAGVDEARDALRRTHHAARGVAAHDLGQLELVLGGARRVRPCPLVLRARNHGAVPLGARHLRAAVVPLRRLDDEPVCGERRADEGRGGDAVRRPTLGETGKGGRGVCRKCDGVPLLERAVDVVRRVQQHRRLLEVVQLDAQQRVLVAAVDHLAAPALLSDADVLVVDELVIAVGASVAARTDSWW